MLALTARVQHLDVVLRHKGDVIEQGLETLAIFFLAGQGHGAKGSAMIRTLQRHELRFGFASGFVPGEAGEFDGAFHRLGTAVRKENAVKA